MQDTCHNEPSKYDLTRHETPRSSVVIERPTGALKAMVSMTVKEKKRGRESLTCRESRNEYTRVGEEITDRCRLRSRV